MLTFVEEIILLLLQNDGRQVPVPSRSLNYALAGAVLMDLAMENRIDTDLERLFPVDNTPLDDSLLDATLTAIKAETEQRDTRYWLERTARDADAIHEEGLARLVAKGILERAGNRLMWVFRARRYPIIDGAAEREVKLRIMGVLFSDELPSPRDAMLMCLVDACDLFKELLTQSELEKAAPRIEVVANLDLIGHTIAQAINEFEARQATGAPQVMGQEHRDVIKGDRNMLTFVEEIILLLLRDDGREVHVPSWSLNYALAGAVLMDLAMENRIDTDLKRLILVNATPLNDSLLDPTLMTIKADTERRDTRYWLEQTAQNATAIHEEALARLVAKGILERTEDKVLWVFRSRRYPSVDGTAEREVKLRIMGVLFSDEIPSPRDAMLMCLVDSCGLFRELLTRSELEKAAPRIEVVANLDLIGHTVSEAIYEIEASVASSLQSHMF